jgi:hypothetical protein
VGRRGEGGLGGFGEGSGIWGRNRCLERRGVEGWVDKGGMQGRGLDMVVARTGGESPLEARASVHAMGCAVMGSESIFGRPG